MPRVCSACGRDLTAEFHDVDGKRLVHGGRRGLRYARNWACRVRLVGTSPTTGKTNAPLTNQRTSDNDARYVREERLQRGGDLHDA
jgi:hypothetical protein